MLADHASYSGIEVTKHDQLVSAVDITDFFIKAAVEFVLALLIGSQCWDITAEECGILMVR